MRHACLHEACLRESFSEGKPSGEGRRFALCEM